MVAGETSLKARRILDELKKCDITHIVWLPDSEARFMYDTIMGDESFTLVPVCREGETIAVATGLIIGGKEPVILIQSTGFFESGDSVRGLALDLKLPLLMIIGYRGFRRDAPIADSAATYLEPILDAWGINHYLVESDTDAEKISQAHKEAHDSSKPVAILIGREYQ